jgi:hypothetical protein
MGLQLAPRVVADIEWAVVSLTGLIAVVSLVSLHSKPIAWSACTALCLMHFVYVVLGCFAACYALGITKNNSLALKAPVEYLSTACLRLPPSKVQDASFCAFYLGSIAAAHRCLSNKSMNE